jgi:calcineurin-like phosphoesterase family protein
MEYFTSDEHYGHDEIITHCKRPFRNSQIMIREIVKRHNSLVTEEDTVYHLGDFTMAGPGRSIYVEQLLRRLNGTHILILGNHDRIAPMEYVSVGFQSVHTSYMINRGDHTVVMAHDPSIWNTVADKGVIFLCGHIHNLFKSVPEKLIVNVGVDVWDFYPITLTQILIELGL